MRLRNIFFLLIATLVIACGGSDDGIGSGNEENNSSNSNSTNINTNTTVRERTNVNNNSALEFAKRPEVPKLHNGENDMFVVHTTEYGVNYIVEWDCKKRAQRWVAYEMLMGGSYYPKSWNRNNWKNTEWHGDPFQVDPDIPAEYRTNPNQIYDTQYFMSRGHMCPSADRLRSKEVNEQTYYMSNIVPQNSALNEGIWLDMENKLRSWVNSKTTVYVVKGSTMDNANDIMGYNIYGLLIPKYFYMAFILKNSLGYYGLAFWTEHHTNKNHSGENLYDYAITIDELEKRTGIDFFCNLPDDIENQAESRIIYSTWGLTSSKK